VSGLKPKPGGNPADVPPDYLYNRDGNFYVDPRNPYVWMVSEITPPPVIDRRVLPNGEVEEWERGRSTPEDFIYDPETDAYYAPGNEPGAPSTGYAERLREDEERAAKYLEELRSKPRLPNIVIPDWVFAKSRERQKAKTPAPKRDSRQRTLFSDDDEPPLEDQAYEM
jgi:hypothetical protein